MFLLVLIILQNFNIVQKVSLYNRLLIYHLFYRYKYLLDIL